MARGEHRHHTRHRNDTAAGLVLDRGTKDVGTSGAAQGTMDRYHPQQDGAAANSDQGGSRREQQQQPPAGADLEQQVGRQPSPEPEQGSGKTADAERIALVQQAPAGLATSRSCSLSRTLLSSIPMAGTRAANGHPLEWKYLRDKYAKEAAKVAGTERSGCVISDVYKPNWIYFGSLRFLTVPVGGYRNIRKPVQHSNWSILVFKLLPRCWVDREAKGRRLLLKRLLARDVRQMADVVLINPHPFFLNREKAPKREYFAADGYHVHRILGVRKMSKLIKLQPRSHRLPANDAILAVPHEPDRVTGEADDSSSSEDDDDGPAYEAMFRELFDAPCAVPKVKEYVLTVMNAYSDKEFRRNFRLARVPCYDLIDQFEGSSFFSSTSHHGGSPTKTAEEHILSFHWYVANKSSMRECALLFNMADSTVLAVIDRVLEFLCSIAPDIICFAADKGALANDLKKLRYVEFTTVDKITRLIIGCCVLHNICMDAGDMSVEDILTDEERRERREDIALHARKSRAELEAVRQPQTARDNVLRQLGEAKRNTVAQLF
ncbi:hypothetical protein HPB47_012580 [Ixodes persulcatus]|uniref:Uncharacterized protein n=1 Tax=Ixodes persulcatus TaxID=34615 RepID=A0AC60NT86_IXOPE|nr:hypothetical protein HPB47_012580 [Ixodes persulcatus]